MATDSVPGRVSDHAAELLAEENASAAELTATLRARLDELLASFTRRWVRDRGNIKARPEPGSVEAGQAAAIADDLTRELAALRNRFAAAVDRLPQLADDAYRTGVRQALQEAGRSASQAPSADPEPPDTDGVHAAVRDKLELAGRRARQGLRRHTDLVAAVAPAHSAVSTVEGAARTTINQAANRGVAQVCDDLGAARLWLAERDACLHCLAHHGHVAEPGDTFPLGLTFADKPLAPWPDLDLLAAPPLHPRCRCRLSPWLGSLGDEHLPGALRREARRSVALGWALPSESQQARRRAARRLIDRGAAGLPKSVVVQARRKLARDTVFNTPVPSK